MTQRIVESDEFIKAALAEADPMVLQVILTQLGDPAAKGITYSTVPGLLVGDFTIISNPDDIALLQNRMFDYLRRMRDEGLEFPAAPTNRERLHELINMATSATVPEGDLDFWIEESGVFPMAREVSWDTVSPARRQKIKVVVIGAGFSGVYAAVQLKRAGVPFEVLERHSEVGGTWHVNTYPGIRVDVPSQAYSYSFLPAYPWRHVFAPQSELAEYIDYVTDKFEIRENIRFNTEVTGATWDEADQAWKIDVRNAQGASESISANAILSATGLLSQPRMPDIAGLDEFEGTIMHTARWDHSVELAGKRVAVIGTGSSGMQITPDLAPLVGHLTVFQRSAGWVASPPGYRAPLSDKAIWLGQAIPYYANWARIRLAWQFSDQVVLPNHDVDPDWDPTLPSVSARNNYLRTRLLESMAAQIGDRPDLMEKCTPTYPAMAKRLVMDNGWFQALRRDDVDLINDSIDRITPRGILMKNGTELPFDIIVCASGFRANDFLFPMSIAGRDGMTLNELWSKDGGRAYLGMVMPHIPNFWCLYGGPNTNPKSGNPILLVEMMTRFIMGSLKAIVEDELGSLEIREDVFDEFQVRLDAALSTGVWNDRRQKSYYRNENGRVDVMTPWGVIQYWRWTAAPDLDEFLTTPAHRNSTANLAETGPTLDRQTDTARSVISPS